MSFSFKQGDRPLDGYTIQRGVGRGGFGEVYHALSDGGKEVALKYLRDHPQVELRGVAHCLNLKSPYLVTVYDVRQNADGQWFVIMEYVAGLSLRDLMLESPAGLGTQKAAFFLREIARGLAYLHDRGIVHRDLKPGNIFYEDGYVKIGDYGLSKAMSPSQHSGQTMSVGTVHYMAPEIGSGNYSKTIDIYALGVILYEMLLGRVPYQGATMGEVLMKHLTAQPEVDELPAPFPEVIRKALAKDPADRFQTVGEMVREIFASPDLEASVSAFEPASLTTIAARAIRPAPPPVVGPLGTGSSNVTELLGRTPHAEPPPAAATARRAPGAEAAGLGDLRRRIFARQNLPKLVIGTMLTFVASVGASLLTRDGPGAMSTIPITFGYIASIVAGVIVGTWYSFTQLQSASFWAHRCINVGCVATCMGVMVLLTVPFWIGSEFAGRSTMPPADYDGRASPLAPDVAAAGHDASARASGEDTSARSLARDWRPRFPARRINTPLTQLGDALPRALNWSLPVALLVLFGDWSGRVFAGRRGQVRGGPAFLAGLFAFVVSQVIGLDRDAFTLAAIAAAASLAVEAACTLWPLEPGEVVPATARGRSRRRDREAGAADAPAAENAVASGASDVVRVDRGPVRAPPPILPSAGRTGAAVDSPADPSAAPAEAAAARRHPLIRTAWLAAGVVLIGIALMLYIGYGLGTFNEADAGPAVGSATASVLFAIFAISRSIGVTRRGIWRGVVRPFFFTLGLAVCAIAAAIIGLTSLREDDLLIAVGFIIAGSLLSLFIWFVPVPPYTGPGATPPDLGSLARRRARGYLIAGAIVLGVMPIPAVIISEELRGSDEEVAMALTLVPMGLTALGLMITGLVKYFGAPSASKPALSRTRLRLPLQKSFDVPGQVDLDDLIQRHFLLLGYHPATRARLLWSFERGNWAAQFWQSDPRNFKTMVNVAAYENPDGYRVNVYVDVQTGWNTLNQKQIGVFAREIDDLESLLTRKPASAYPATA